MVTVIRGLDWDAASAVISAVLTAMHEHGIHYDYWSWWIAAEGRLVVTNDDGAVVNDNAANVELLSTQLVVKEAAVNGGLLENISTQLEGVPVWLNMTKIEASIEGSRL